MKFAQALHPKGEGDTYKKNKVIGIPAHFYCFLKNPRLLSSSFCEWKMHPSHFSQIQAPSFPLDSQGHFIFLQHIPRRMDGGKTFSPHSVLPQRHSTAEARRHVCSAELSFIGKTWDPTFMSADVHGHLQIRRLDVMQSFTDRQFKKQKAAQKANCGLYQ